MPEILETSVIDEVATLAERYIRVRQRTEQLVAPLSEADAQLQSMPDASPAKWHLAHTTWFFETFILCVYSQDYHRFNESYNYLFNSYYNGIGDQYPRHQRGLVSRPSLSEVIDYRQVIDRDLCKLLLANGDDSGLLQLVELGLQHEQQHQELLLTDIKHALFHNPVFPAYYTDKLPQAPHREQPLNWVTVDGGLTTIGCAGKRFSFDNERPAHSVFVNDFMLASRLVTNGDFLAFIDNGGYVNPDCWLADGWAWLQQQDSSRSKPVGHPLYWIKQDGGWFEYSLYGLIPLDLNQPVIHVNFYEASAYANWLGARLPTEFEWELAVRQARVMPNKSKGSFHPASDDTAALSQVFDCAWQWTSSSYSAYPGFTPFSGVAGEYNGKFMSNQLVLRGSSCATQEHHSRVTYRNFFYPHQSWQFTGIRLAK